MRNERRWLSMLALVAGVLTAPAVLAQSFGDNESEEGGNAPAEASEKDSVKPPPSLLPTPEEAVRSKYPYTPEEIEQLRSLLQEVSEAETSPLGEEPEERKRVVIADLTTASSAIPMAVSPDYLSSITFLDASGNPWPIKNYTLGIGDSNKLQATDISDHILATTPMQSLRTNALVTLVGLNQPLSIRLSTEREPGVYDTLEIQVPKAGPSTTGTGGTRSIPDPEVLDPGLSRFVTMTPPGGANAVELDGAPGKETHAWRHKGRLVIRTNHALARPSPQGVLHSTGDIRVYALDQARSLLLLDDAGNSHSVRVRE